MTIYTCPMHPEIRQDKPGACPKCGMALEPITASATPPTPAGKVEYTCPMHPQIVRDEAGSCPICGMALEPRTAMVTQYENPELVDMTRRLWVTSTLTLPVFVMGMADLIPGQPLNHLLSMRAVQWFQFALATPVVLWAVGRGWCQ